MVEDPFNPANLVAQSEGANLLPPILPPSMKRVADGLAILYYTLAIGILVGIALSVWNVINHQAPAARSTQLGWQLFAIVTIVLNLIGMWLCLDTPPESGATRSLKVSIILSLCALGMNLIRHLAPEAFVFPSTAAANNSLPIIVLRSAITLTTLALNWSSRILLVLYLWKLALYLAEKNLATRAKIVIIGGIIMAVLIATPVILVVIMAPIGGMRAPESIYILFGLAMLGFVALSLYVLVKYLTLLSDLQKRILSLLG